ncbi:MAG: hypothetical protein JWR69_3010, partial [Pedosphaera sp.]|nr:hypothetical protein [Pedosphaera sp.]
MKTRTQLRTRYVATAESSHISLRFQRGLFLLLLGLITVLSGAGFRAQATPPYSATQAPTQITANSANLNGMASPNGDVSVAWFEWGTNSNYGQTTGAVDVGAGNGVVTVTAGLSGLAGHASYYFRLVVSNAVGLAFGGQQQLITGGKILGWGDNTSGPESSPGVLRQVVAVAAGVAHSLALQTDGRVVAWGTSTAQPSNVPVSATNVVAIACGDYYSLALKNNGTLAAWGAYQDGLGVAGISNVVAIAAGNSYSVALKNDGTVLVRGGPSSVKFVPAGLSNVVAIAARGDHVLALKNDGTLFGWGDNAFGQSQPPPGLSNVVAIATGPYHSLAVKSDGTVVAWGNSSNGRTNVPAGLSDAVAVAVGGNHSVVLRANGTVVAWGDNTSGQTNVPAGSSNLVAIAAGGNHNLSLTTCGEPLAMTAAATAVGSGSGTLNGMVFQDEPSALAWFEWGSTRSLGQVAGPVPIIATTNFVSRVSVGVSGLTFGETCFYRLAVSNVFGVAYGGVQQFTTGGKLLAWGYNTSGQTNIPP